MPTGVPKAPPSSSGSLRSTASTAAVPPGPGPPRCQTPQSVPRAVHMPPTCRTAPREDPAAGPPGLLGPASNKFSYLPPRLAQLPIQTAVSGMCNARVPIWPARATCAIESAERERHVQRTRTTNMSLGRPATATCAAGWRKNPTDDPQACKAIPKP